MIYGCVTGNYPDLQILLCDNPQCGGKDPRTRQDNIGMHHDVSRTLRWVYGPCGHSLMGFTDLYFCHEYQLINKDILLTLHLSPWEVLTTGYLDA